MSVIRSWWNRVVAGVVALVAAALAVRAATHFPQTYDEAAHIAAGLEWLQTGRYQYDPQHPPLARIAVALGPALAGAHLHHQRTVWEEGNAILVAGGHYARTLTLARLGVVPFFLLLLAVTWMWARRLDGEGAAALAVLLVGSTPQLLAHAGLATTDLPVAATVCAALYTFSRWLDHPTRGSTLAFALALGAALVTKLSSLPFLGFGIPLIAATRWALGRQHATGRAADPPGPDAAAPAARGKPEPFPPVRFALAGALGAALVVWATYRFHVVLARGVLPVPAPEFLGGLRQLVEHNRGGHSAYLFGRVSDSGWWYYPLVALAVKTPLPLLTLTVVAVAVTWRERTAPGAWRLAAPLVAAAGIIVTAMLASIDIGIRHILPIYPLLAVAGAVSATRLWHQAREAAAPRTLTRAALAALVAGQAASTLRAYPDFLARFNALAGREPDRILVDSNLDWGQDLRRLADTLAAHRVSSVTLFYFGTTPVGALRLADTVRLGGTAPATGWVAVSRTYLRGVYADCATWLRSHRPIARIGHSMLLYRILPDTAPHVPEGATPVRAANEPYGAVLGTPERGRALCSQPRILMSRVAVPLVAEREPGSGSTAGEPDLDSVPGAEPGAGAIPSLPLPPLPPLPPVTDQRLLDATTNTSDWLTYGHDYTNRRYVALDQINTRNVHTLTLAWVHQLESQPGAQESSPIVADGVLYYTGPHGILVAVDAATGRELWRHQHKLAPVPTCCGAVNRGVAVYHDKVYLSTLDAHLLALDRRTGRVVWDVQVVDPEPGYSMTSAPLALDGKIIVGVSGSEFPIRGFVDAYDAETGSRAWRFWTIPSPEDGGWWGRWSPTTPDGDRLPRDIAQEKRDSARYADAWRHGGGGVWNTPSFDPALGLIYFGVGNPAPNMDASVRPGDNLYTVSIVAVDIRSGKLRWYYQQVPHDQWDYDATSPTVLLDLPSGGSRVPAVAEAGKVGWVYILDRRTGERIRRTAPFVPHENTFAAPTPEGVRIMPGMGGGSNSAPPSYSPRTGLLYVSGVVEPILFVLAPERMQPGVKWQGGRHIPLAPARGTFTAIDAATGEIRWQRQTAQRMLGTGSVVTAGDVVFYGEQQGVFNAADAQTGEVLWTAQVGGHLRAPPITYALGGRQYVVIAAGGALFAFTLPER